MVAALATPFQPSSTFHSSCWVRVANPSAGNAAAGRSNHLLLDDTAEQIQVQLKSDHQHSSLSLGHITRIEDRAGRQEHRGEGFELRTDGHGAIRAQDGLLISTEGRPNAQGHVKASSETASRLSQGQEQHSSLGHLAAQHKAQDDGDNADQGQVAKALHAQNEAIKGKEGKHPELSEPHLVLASPAGIESTTTGSTHQHSQEHHAITAGGHVSTSTAKSWLVSAKEAIKLFAFGSGKQDTAKSGIRMVSAKEDIDIQALQKSVNLLAKMDITVTGNVITLTAGDKLTINGAGSQTVWSAAGIHSTTAGSHTAHASSHDQPKGKDAPVNVAVQHVADAPLQSLRFAPIGADSLLKEAGYESAPFALHDQDGQTIASGAIAANKISSRQPQEKQSQLTLTIGKQEVELIDTPAASSSESVEQSAPAEPVEQDPQLAELEQLILTQSPYYQATAGADAETATLSTEQLQGLLKLTTHESSEEVRSAHHE